ncbi:MAG: alpha/beta hydrolase [Spirulinaceae cyanobacterium]
MVTIDILGVPHTYELTPPVPQPSKAVLVFIHGWLLSRRYWNPLIEQLSTSHQCLTYDLRGFGDSQENPTDNPTNSSREPDFSRLTPQNTQDSSRGNYTLAAYAQDLRFLLQKLHIEKAWLIGHSLGGSIAVWGAELLPEQVQGVICLNSGGGIYLEEEFERFRSAGKQLVKRRPSWLKQVPLMDFIFSRIMVERPLNRYWGRQRLIDFVAADTKAALGSLLDSTTEKEVHLLPQIVSRLKQPVYFLAGAKDKVMEPQYVRHLASFHRSFGNCGDNVIEISGCGHMSMVERTDAVASEISIILQNHELSLPTL